MYIPVWLGNFVLFSFSFLIVIVCLFLLRLFAILFFEELIPWVWYRIKVLRIKSMDAEHFYRYLDSLEEEWFLIQEKKHIKRQKKGVKKVGSKD